MASLACVINNFNYERYVGQAIRSALDQSVPFRQIVVVDDGSTDDSRKIIETFGSQIDFVASENRGQTAACLTGLQRVNADYILFLDADDYLAGSFVEQIAPLLNIEPAPAKVQYQLVTIADDGCTLGCFPTYPVPYATADMRRDNEAAGFYQSPPTTGNVIRCDVLRGFDEKLLNPRGAIDGTLNLVLPYCGEIVSVNMPLAFKREHTRNMSGWSAPTCDLLQKEIATFKDTWTEACKLLGRPARDFDAEPPTYLLERYLMLRALDEQPGVAAAAASYVRAMLKRRPVRLEAVALCLWAISLCLPIRKWRQRSINARRSPVNRSATMDGLMRLLLRKTRPKPSLSSASS
jgi:hypothetical protein